jgi:hypothetical protein
MVESQPPGRNIYANNILYSQSNGIRMSQNMYLHNLIRVPRGGKPVYSTGYGGFGWTDTVYKNNLLEGNKLSKNHRAKEIAQNVEDSVKVTANPADMTLTVELTKPIEAYPAEEYCPVDYYGNPRTADATMPGPFDKLEVGKPVTVHFFPQWLRDDPARMAQAQEALGE